MSFSARNSLHLPREMFFQLLFIPQTVEQESTAPLQILEHIILVYVCRIMTCHEISCRDEICRLNLVLSESQVGNRDTARLLGIIAEISLCVQIRIIADNLNRTLIRAYGTVRAETPRTYSESYLPVRWTPLLQKAEIYL